MAKGKKKSSYTPYIVFVGVALAILAGIYFILPRVFPTSYSEAKKVAGDAMENVVPAPEVEKPKPVMHVKTPEAVKGIYMTSCAAGTPSYRTRLTKLIEDTELNAVVIDIKDFSGTISYEPTDPTLKEYAISNCKVKDMKELIEMLHQKNIYVIGRITTFQDPLFTKLHPETAVKSIASGGSWKDRKGIAYIFPGSKDAQEHVIALAKDSYALGFDEINFDYVRFPTDGVMADMTFPGKGTISKSEVLETFFKHLHDSLEGTGVVTSADLFGMTTTAEDDMGIGQIQEAALPYFDYIMPMVYPSHYPATFNGWKNPNAFPYDLIKFVMGAAVRRAAATTTPIKTLFNQPVASTSPQKYTHEPVDIQKLRPWLQDFDLGQPAYGAQQVRDQIQATYDVGLTSWIMWDASNKYSPGAFLPE